jgi:acetoin utilization deacetylase AcuC-like enzyme
MFGAWDTPALVDALLQTEAHPPTEAQIRNVHPALYLQSLRRAVEARPGLLDGGDTYVTSASLDAALTAAGGGLAVLEQVLSGRAATGFALIRPPGHHATSTQAMGFCLLNNIAIVARQAQSQGYRRVMIVDFDVHHGNGTEAIFAEDPDVLYLSTHQAGIYPGTGQLQDRGWDAGEGTIINIPLPAGAGDHALRAVAEQILPAVAARFEPQILLVSAGFDAHWRDPLAWLQVSTEGFSAYIAALARLAEAFCAGRSLFLLEGGYDPQALGASVKAGLHVLAGLTPPRDTLGPAPHAEPAISPLIEQVLKIHALSPGMT